MPKLLVVDDSALTRRYLKDLFANEPDFALEFARSGREALERLPLFVPDVLTLDVNMPEMDGLTALRHIMRERPTPVVMLSALTRGNAQATLEALALGAVDCVGKPEDAHGDALAELGRQIVHKVRVAARSRVGPRPEVPAPWCAPAREATVHGEAPTTGDAPGLVVIGVSTGGPTVLEQLLPRLPAAFPWPVVVVQHMPEAFTGPLAERLNQHCALRVVEAVDAMPLAAGAVYLAKGGCDSVLVRRGGRICIAPTPADAEKFWHPSVELMVRSAMRMFTPRALIGVMLTGMGFDGADAMADLRRQGGRTVAESEESAVVWGMPGELVRRDGASQVAPYEDIPIILSRWLGLGTPAAMPSHATLHHRICK